MTSDTFLGATNKFEKSLGSISSIRFDLRVTKTKNSVIPLISAGKFWIFMGDSGVKFVYVDIINFDLLHAKLDC